MWDAWMTGSTPCTEGDQRTPAFVCRDVGFVNKATSRPARDGR